MKKRPLLSMKTIVIFVALVVICGGALSATGNFENPVKAMRDMIELNQLLLTPADDSFSDDFADDSAFADMPDPANHGINWAQFGNVVFDLWFIFAATAFVIVFQRITSLRHLLTKGN